MKPEVDFEKMKKTLEQIESLSTPIIEKCGRGTAWENRVRDERDQADREIQRKKLAYDQALGEGDKEGMEKILSEIREIRGRCAKMGDPAELIDEIDKIEIESAKIDRIAGPIFELWDNMVLNINGLAMLAKLSRATNIRRQTQVSLLRREVEALKEQRAAEVQAQQAPAAKQS